MKNLGEYSHFKNLKRIRRLQNAHQFKINSKVLLQEARGCIYRCLAPLHTLLLKMWDKNENLAAQRRILGAPKGECVMPEFGLNWPCSL